MGSIARFTPGSILSPLYGQRNGLSGLGECPRLCRGLPDILFALALSASLSLDCPSLDPARDLFPLPVTESAAHDWRSVPDTEGEGLRPCLPRGGEGDRAGPPMSEP